MCQSLLYVGEDERKADSVTNPFFSSVEQGYWTCDMKLDSKRGRQAGIVFIGEIRTRFAFEGFVANDKCKIVSSSSDNQSQVPTLEGF